MENTTKSINAFNKAPIPKGYIIEVIGWKQYAEGITGINRWQAFYSDNGAPFLYKKDAIAAAKEANLKAYRIKGEHTPYGEVGGAYQGINLIPAYSVSDAADLACEIKTIQSI